MIYPRLHPASWWQSYVWAQSSWSLGVVFSVIVWISGLFIWVQLFKSTENDDDVMKKINVCSSINRVYSRYIYRLVFFCLNDIKIFTAIYIDCKKKKNSMASYQIRANVFVGRKLYSKLKSMDINWKTNSEIQCTYLKYGYSFSCFEYKIMSYLNNFHIMATLDPHLPVIAIKPWLVELLLLSFLPG